MFGTLAVALRIYLMPFLYRPSRSAELLALPRYRLGRTSTGKGDADPLGESAGRSWGSPSGPSVGPDDGDDGDDDDDDGRWRWHKPNIVDDSGSLVDPTQRSGKLRLNATKPPDNNRTASKVSE